MGAKSPRGSLRSFDPRGARRAGFPATHGKDAVAAGTGYAVLDHDFGAVPGRPPRAIRVGPGGEREASFGSAGVAEVPTPAQGIRLGLLIVADARGRVTVLGTLYSTSPGGGPLSPGIDLAVRFDARGTLDEKFGGDGIASLPSEYLAIAVSRPRGGLLLGLHDGAAGVALLQLTAAGAPDRRFGNRGVRPFRVRARQELDFVRLHALRSLPGGAIMAAVRWDETQRVIRLLPDGRRDPRFRSIAVPRSQRVTAFGRDASGRVLVAYTGFGAGRAYLSRYDWRGRMGRLARNLTLARLHG